MQIALGANVKDLREAIAGAHHWSDDPAEMILSIAKESNGDGTWTWLKVDITLKASYKEASTASTRKCWRR